MHEPTKHEVGLPQRKGRYDRDIEVHAWPIQCQHQSICIGHCNDNKRTLKKLMKVLLKSEAELLFIESCVVSWNALPPDVVNTLFLLAFKCRLDSTVENEFNVPIALSAFRDKGSRLWSL